MDHTLCVIEYILALYYGKIKRMSVGFRVNLILSQKDGADGKRTLLRSSALSLSPPTGTRTFYSDKLKAAASFKAAAPLLYLSVFGFFGNPDQSIIS